MLFVVGLLLYSMVREYRPSAVEQIAVGAEAQVVACDTVALLSWNIAYGGLGDDMDFFMDGGESSRTSRGRTLENLSVIVDSLKSWSAEVDFFALQEVDIKAKRSYGINEFEAISEALGEDFSGYYTPNFKVFYVPIPLSDPIGEVDGGLAIFSRYTPQSVERVAYPNSTSWPQRIFDLKRCILSAKVLLNDRGDFLYINNTHNSAYDDGGGRTKEFEFLKDFLADKPYSITLGDWNSVPPNYILSDAELTDEHFKVERFSEENLPEAFHVVADLTAHSARYGYEPFDAATTTQTLIDYAVSSPAVRPLSVEYIDLGYRNSDHNPVLFRFEVSHLK